MLQSTYRPEDQERSVTRHSKINERIHVMRRQLANTSKHGIQDTNGNTVGFWTVTK